MEMQTFIEQRGIASMDEICGEFNIALNTARKDISDLAKSGLIQKIYGGAKAINITSPGELLPYEKRMLILRKEKMDIAKRAAAFIEDGDTIFLDSGTTCAGILDALYDKNVSVFTTNVEVIINSLKYDNLDVYLIGGKLNRKSYSIQKIWDLDYLKNFNINKSFMAASGFSIEGGATHASQWEYDIKRFAMDQSTHQFLMIDSTKIGKKTLIKYAEATEFKTIVLDKKPSEKYCEFFRQNGIEMYLPEK